MSAPTKNLLTREFSIKRKKCEFAFTSNLADAEYLVTIKHLLDTNSDFFTLGIILKVGGVPDRITVNITIPGATGGVLQ